MTDARTVTVAELTVTRPSGTVETILLGDGPLLPLPGDDPDWPHAAVRQRLAGPPSYAVGLSADPSRLAGDVGAGELVILNGDRAYSWLAGCAPGRLRVRRSVEGQRWQDMTPVLDGRAGLPRPAIGGQQAGRMTVPIWDLRAALDTDVVTRKYLGTNTDHTGYEGGDALKDATAPLCLGRPLHVPGVAVNEAGRAWAWHAEAARAGAALYDRGSPAVLSAVPHAGGTAFDGLSLTATQYAEDAARSLLRLGGALGGELGIDPLGPAGTDTAPDAVRWLLSRAAAGTIGATLTGWTSAAGVGAWWSGAVTHRAALELMARSAGASVLPDALGRWQVAALGLTDPVGAITEGMVLDLAIDDADLAAPVWEVTVKGRRNHLVLARDRQAADVRETDRGAWLREEWRREVARHQPTKDRFGDAARVAEVQTALTSTTAMAALAARLLTALGVRADGEPRRSLALVVPMTAAALSWPLGATLHVSYPPDGIDDDMQLMGVHYASPSRTTMRVRLFG
ncbi:hypothetical protein HL658_36215 [Azospirillum sp. RWY-5-1]|uniref:Phage tail protein n=1 Tax=Azospirillum oleiclasticum TaxID=2735135 RepID=A0ABX2TMU9_9PROT|nr:hypothetical protein [Azospirillum oleiclasticum]NYZ18013.1 hypothetical protein [Azospirillum oleiclasticum]NYZ25176.1 hypothetical protein [Azospirillum oleiclasticum]